MQVVSPARIHCAPQGVVVQRFWMRKYRKGQHVELNGPGGRAGKLDEDERVGPSQGSPQRPRWGLPKESGDDFCF